MADWVETYHDPDFLLAEADALVPGMTIRAPVPTYSKLPYFADSGQAHLVEDEGFVYVCSNGRWCKIDRADHDG
jgi:hypothetical protein